MVIEIAITLLIHFILGWPIWLSFIIGHSIWLLLHRMTGPLRGEAPGPLSPPIIWELVIGVIIEIPIYLLIVVALYLIGRPSW